LSAFLLSLVSWLKSGERFGFRAFLLGVIVNNRKFNYIMLD